MAIVLLTDFGDSSFVGQMKGVISIINPEIRIIDLSHSIEKFNILEAGFTLFNSIQYFSDSSIFVCVVDPGVGSNRKPILIQTDKYYFIGPDNGLFTMILDKLKILKVIEITNFDIFNNNVSSTFHGRDIFAPAAALLSKKQDINILGLELDSTQLNRNDSFYPYINDNIIIGSIICSDSFGNVITNINESYLINRNLLISFSSWEINKISKTFSDVEIGNFVAYVGSSNYLELGLNQGNLSQVIRDSIHKETLNLHELEVKLTFY